MNLSFSSGTSGTKYAAFLATVLAFAVSVSACAQEEATAQTPAAAGIDPAVLDLFLESRTQKPADQATAEERDGVTKELTDIYNITDLPAAIELGKEPRTRAQIDLQRRAILFNAFAIDFIEKNPASDQEIFNAYEEQAALAPPMEFKARHILVESQAEALGLITELKGGADFQELAKTKSTGPSGPSGGDLGWFGAQAMVKPFSDAVASMEDGKFSESPVQSQFGWHVILREDSRESAAPPLDSVRDVIKQRVEQDKLQTFIEELRES